MRIFRALATAWRRLRADVERESRTWMIACTACGRERSVWAAGGVRYRALGEKRTIGFCRGCGGLRPLRIYRKAQG